MDLIFKDGQEKFKNYEEMVNAIDISKHSEEDIKLGLALKGAHWDGFDWEDYFDVYEDYIEGNESNIQNDTSIDLSHIETTTKSRLPLMAVGAIAGASALSYGSYKLYKKLKRKKEEKSKEDSKE